MDVLGFIGRYCDVRTLAALSRTSQAADSNKAWIFKAKVLGWKGTQNVDEAKLFMQDLTSGLKKMGFSLPKKVFNRQKVQWNSKELFNILLNINTRRYGLPKLSNEEILSMLYFLSAKTRLFKGKINYNLNHNNLFSYTINSNPESLASYAKLLDNLGDDLFIKYQPAFFVLDTDLSYADAEKVLDCASKNVNYADLLTAAASKNHLGWIKALVKRQTNTETQSTPRTTAALNLFLEAGLTFPKSDLFLAELIQNSSEEVIFAILDIFKEEERDVKFLLMNNRRDRGNLPNSNLYELASQAFLSPNLIRKFDPKLTYF